MEFRGDPHWDRRLTDAADMTAAVPPGRSGSGQRPLTESSLAWRPVREQTENSGTVDGGGTPLYYRLLFSLAIMGLFTTWLMPLHQAVQMADTEKLLELLLLSAAALLLWGSFRMPGLLQLGVQLLMMALTWFRACTIHSGSGWSGSYAAELGNDAALFFTGHVSELTEYSRLLILVLGWGLLVASVQQLGLYRGSIALFTAVTVLYLLVLDIAFSIDTTIYVPAAAGLILWMRGLSYLLQLKERTYRAELPYFRWSCGALAVAVLLTAAAWMSGQLSGARPAAPVTLRPVLEQLQQWAEGEISAQTEEGQLSAGTTGYGSGEGELGAPLSPSRTPVFTVTASRPAYWRGESLGQYDGRRWLADGTLYEPLNLTGLPSKKITAAGGGGGQMLQQRIEFAIPSSGGLPLFSAGTAADVEQVELEDGSRMGYILSNPEKNRFRLPDAGASERITAYTVDSLLPEDDPAVLRSLQAADPPAIAGQYLQLPADLPERVTVLSKRLTASADNRYDAVAAVQNYLQRGYTYTLETRIPPADTDFVDDFLFTTEEGYCVHFASAMTVLLRSSGIPARYVRGYGPGTPEDSVSGPGRYQVTQADAHAWVEVYFPGAGWVPFDPTPGTAFAAAGPGPAALPAAAPAPAPQEPPSALPLAGGNPAPPALAALVLAAAWRWRRSLALLPAARRAGRSGRERQLRAAALAWRGLAARYGPPPQGLTAREYAASLAIEDARLRAAVRQFVRQWEALAYSSAGPAPPGAAEPQAMADAAFIGHCLIITFRLA